MWTHTLVLISILIAAHSHPLVESLTPYIPRDLAGLLDSDGILPAQNAMTRVATLATVVASGTTSRMFGGIVTSEIKATKSTSTTTMIGTTHSIIGTLPTTAVDAPAKLSPSSTIGANSATPSFSVEATPEAARMPPGEAAEWRVIGLVVICIGFVATAILSIVFFDSWWGFLRDLACGKRRQEGIEDMVPDWDKRSWEFKLASEDGHRYPTLASLECIAKEHAEGDQDASVVFPVSSHLRPCPDLTSSRPPYLSNRDPHPLEPLFRRPSMRQMTPPQARS